MAETNPEPGIVGFGKSDTPTQRVLETDSRVVALETTLSDEDIDSVGPLAEEEI